MTTCTQSPSYLLFPLKEDKENLRYEKSSAVISSNTLKAIVDEPSTKKMIKSLDISEVEIKIGETSQNTKIFASSSLGVIDRYQEESSEAAFGSISVDRLFHDNDQTRNSIAVLRKKREIKLLELRLHIEQKIYDYLLAFFEYEKASDKIEIITRYMEEFEDKESLLEKAISLGVIENSLYLEVKNLKNGVLSNLSDAKLKKKNSYAFLKSSSQGNEKGVMSELARFRQASEQTKNRAKSSVKEQIINLEKDIANIKIEIERQRGKPVTNLSASVASPQSKRNQTTIFAGLTMQFPIKDGGKSSLEIELLNKKEELLESEKKSLNKAEKLAIKNWENFQEFFNTQSSIINTQIDIGQKKTSELEKLVAQGKSNIAAYAKQIIETANNELKHVDLEYSRKVEMLKKTNLLSENCSLLDLCGKINAYLKNFKGN